MSQVCRPTYYCQWCHEYLEPDPQTPQGLLYIHLDLPHPEDPDFGPSIGAHHVYPLPSKRHEN